MEIRNNKDTCEECGGSGYVDCRWCYDGIEMVCECGGEDLDCGECNGTGYSVCGWCEGNMHTVCPLCD